MQNASKLVSIAGSIAYDVDLCYGRYIVDAKSMLGVLSLPDFAYGELQIPVETEANEKVAFLKLNNLVIETYENKAAKMESGAIDHVAIDVKDIEKVYELINQADLNTTRDTIHFLPFWENGVRFFTIEGPNKEKIEFSQYL